VGAEVRLPDNVFVLRCVLLTIALTAACPDIGCGATDRFPAAAVDTHPAQGRTTTRLAQAPPLVDLPPGSLDTNFKKAGEIQSGDAGRSGFKQLREAPSTSGSANPSNGLRLGIQTEQSLQTPKSLRKVNDCPDDDECDEYTGLPRSHPAHSGLKGFRRPYIGLSITSPLQ
jgi:hypothetical protein